MTIAIHVADRMIAVLAVDPMMNVVDLRVDIHDCRPMIESRRATIDHRLPDPEMQEEMNNAKTMLLIKIYILLCSKIIK